MQFFSLLVFVLKQRKRKLQQSSNPSNSEIQVKIDEGWGHENLENSEAGIKFLIVNLENQIFDCKSCDNVGKLL